MASIEPVNRPAIDFSLSAPRCTVGMVRYIMDPPRPATPLFMATYMGRTQSVPMGNLLVISHEKINYLHKYVIMGYVDTK
jgi:hypothetical protein